MKKADAQTLLTLMDELTELMTEYDRRTDRMVTNDLEVIQQVLLSRNELMDKMRQVKQSIMDTANAQVPAERELIRDEHFMQFIGADIMVKMLRPIDSIGREFKGVLKDYSDGKVTIEDHSGENEITISKKDAAWIKLDDFD